jgi:hypothetical protein
VASRVIDFASRHRLDALFWAAFLAAGVVCVLLGFREPVARRFAGTADYEAPLALIVHVYSFSAWFVLVGTQAFLAARGDIRLHRRAGWLLLPLVAIMTVSALGAELHSKRFYAPAHPDQLRFLAGTLTELASFTLLALAAFAFRARPPVHKRLIFVATAVLATAAFRRAVEPLLYGRVEPGLLADLVLIPLGLYLFIGAGLAYDVATRGRPHSALVAAGSLVVVAAWTAILVGATDWWPPIAARILGLD